MTRRVVWSIVCALLATLVVYTPADAQQSNTGVSLAVPSTASATVTITKEPLLQLSNLSYQGAFRLPSGSFCASPNGVLDSFAYGGTALAYDPTKDGLYLVGHDWDQMTAEVSIPAPVNSADLDALNTATVLQNCVDATEGLITQVGGSAPDVKIGGQMVYNGLLYGTVYIYYDADTSQRVSHFVRPLNLSTSGEARGLFQLQSPNTAGFVSGYLSPIPADWQAALGGPAFSGQCCIPIVTRTSYGPAAFAFDPERLGMDSVVPTVPLVYYDNTGGDGDYVNDWNVQSNFFNNGTMMGGAVFVAGTRSVLFIGRQGIGPFCYGEGTSDPALNGTLTWDGETIDCYDPAYGDKGGHSYPYVYQVWAYDANDLAQVASGGQNPWSIRPYGLWTLTFPIMLPTAEIKGATYDPATRRFFVTQGSADGDLPLVHVFLVKF